MHQVCVEVENRLNQNWNMIWNRSFFELILIPDRLSNCLTCSRWTLRIEGIKMMQKCKYWNGYEYKCNCSGLIPHVYGSAGSTSFLTGLGLQARLLNNLPTNRMNRMKRTGCVWPAGGGGLVTVGQTEHVWMVGLVVGWKCFLLPVNGCTRIFKVFANHGNAN